MTLTPLRADLVPVLAKLEAALDFDAAAAWAEEERRREEQRAREQRLERLRRAGCGLKPKVREQIVAGTLDLTASAAISRMVGWRDRGQGYDVLVLQGPTGCGKSVAAAWYLAQSSGLLRGMTAVARAWLSDTQTAALEREAMCAASALVLDDVGTERGPRKVEAVGEALRELLECRQGLKTILTTNLTAQKFRERYPDDRLHSRLQESAWLVVNGPDLRGRR